jgi:hypothetical protein
VNTALETIINLSGWLMRLGSDPRTSQIRSRGVNHLMPFDNKTQSSISVRLAYRGMICKHLILFRLQPSETLHHPLWFIGSNILVEPTASIFRTEDEDSRFLLNIGTYLIRPYNLCTISNLAECSVW